MKTLADIWYIKAWHEHWVKSWTLTLVVCLGVMKINHSLERNASWHMYVWDMTSIEDLSSRLI
jgi:hypothetical protein